MVELLDMPSEIISGIVENLKDDRYPYEDVEFTPLYKGDLTAVSLVSKELRAQAVPFLFEEIHYVPSSIAQKMADDAYPSDSDLNEACMEALSTLTAITEITSLAKKLFFGDLSNIPLPQVEIVMRLTAQLLHASPALREILGVANVCLEFAWLIQIINEHPIVGTVWLDYPTLDSPSLTCLEGRDAADECLRKFKCNMVDTPITIPPADHPILSLLLSHGFQIRYIIVPVDRAAEWLAMHCLSTVEMLSFVGMRDAERGAAASLLRSAVNQHHSISKIRFSGMPGFLFEIARKRVPPVLSRMLDHAGVRDHQSESTMCTVNPTSREVTCRIVGFSLGWDDAFGEGKLLEALTEIVTAFPLLKVLTLELRTSNLQVLGESPEADMRIVETLSNLRELECFSVKSCSALGSVGRLKNMSISLARCLTNFTSFHASQEKKHPGRKDVIWFNVQTLNTGKRQLTLTKSLMGLKSKEVLDLDPKVLGVQGVWKEQAIGISEIWF